MPSVHNGTHKFEITNLKFEILCSGGINYKFET